MSQVPDEYRHLVPEALDAAERVTAATIAMINGDTEGAVLALNGARTELIVLTLLRVLVKTGREGFGEESFIRTMLDWPGNAAKNMGEQP